MIIVQIMLQVYKVYKLIGFTLYYYINRDYYFP